MQPVRPTLDDSTCERLLEIWERTGDDGLRRVADGRAYLAHGVAEPAADDRPLANADEPLDADELLDWARTGLMNAFRLTGDAGAFELLHDLTRDSFLSAIRGRLRGQPVYVDAHDVLQEVFLNIYRYPHRFLPERADAFRNWGHRIVRNTLLKTLKRASRRARVTPLADEFADRPDANARSPFVSAADAESAQVADHAFVLWLNLYLLHYRKLSAREQRALRLVECEGRSYKDTAADLGIRLENLKMVVFRGRRKILRGMGRSLGRLREHFDALATAERPASAARPTAAQATHASPTSAGGPERPAATPPSGRAPRPPLASPGRVPPTAPLPHSSVS